MLLVCSAAARPAGRLGLGERGQVTVEYGMVIILVLVAVIGVVVALRNNLRGVLNAITSALSSRQDS